MINMKKIKDDFAYLKYLHTNLTLKHYIIALLWSLLVFILVILPIVSIMVNLIIISLFNHTLYVFIIFLSMFISSILATRLYYELLKIYSTHQEKISFKNYYRVYLVYSLIYLVIFSVLFFITDNFIYTFTI